MAWETLRVPPAAEAGEPWCYNRAPACPGPRQAWLPGRKMWLLS